MQSKLLLFLAFLLSIPSLNAQHLVGYWQNWNDGNSPNIPLDQIDERYTVVNLAFPLTQSGTDYDMYFTPCCNETIPGLMAKVQTLQERGVIVNLSIGGATIPIELDNDTEKNIFVSSILDIIDLYQLDGIDIDLEGSSLSISSNSSLTNPSDATVVRMIEAIEQIATDYEVIYNKNMFLSAAPETAFVQGGQNNWGGVWGAYLPVLHALRDKMDLLHVQLYNSGSMFGLDGNIYHQGTADFIVSQTEAVIAGFTTASPTNEVFAGFPATKVGIGLPACPSAAGGGFTAVNTVATAVEYLKTGVSPPGSYTLQAGPYPNLGGLMTWSINWDAVTTCNSSAYEFAANYEAIFPVGLCWQPKLGADISACGISFPYSLDSRTTSNPDVTFTWENLTTNQTLVSNDANATTLNINSIGTYQVTRDSAGCSKFSIVTVSNTLATPTLPTTENLCAAVPMTLTVDNAATFPNETTWQWYQNELALMGENDNNLTNVRTAGAYKIVGQLGNCSTENTTTITSDIPIPVDGCAASGNTVDLEVISEENGPFSWFENSSGGPTLGMGKTFTTPILTTTTTYYVESEEALGTATTGPAVTNNNLGTIQNYQQPTEMTFDAHATFTLEEVTIYPLIHCFTHTLTFEIRDANGNVLPNGEQSFSIMDDMECSTVTGPVALTLSNGGVEIPQGTDYKIVQTGDIGINHWQGSVTYPMDFSPYFTIKSSNVADRYLAVHDWVVKGGNCARLPVIAEISPDCNSPLVLAIADLTAQAMPDYIQLNWGISGETADRPFEIFRKTALEGFKKIGEVNKDDSAQQDLQFLDYHIAAQQTYYYQLKYWTKNGEEKLSTVVSVQTSGGIVDYQIFPNPVTTELSIHCRTATTYFKPQKVMILNSQGILLKETLMKQPIQSINVSDLPIGLYFIKISLENQILKTRKLMIQD